MTDQDAKTMIQRALELCKKLQEASDAPELASDLATLRENLQSVREILADLREEKSELAERVKSLEESLELKPTLVRNKGVYWMRADPDPWCPTCWEHEHLAVHLNRSDVMAGRLCSCRRCQYAVNLDNTSPPEEWTE